MADIIHLRNGRADRHPTTRGVGSTWCGKKLIGKPESSDGGIDTFLCYGNEIAATLAPVQASCPHCKAAFDTAYCAAFPDGPKPIATFRLDSPEDMARAKRLFGAEALSRVDTQSNGGGNV